MNGSLTCDQQSYTGVYYQRPTALHAATILRNNTQYNVYNGIEFTARKRLANRWMMNASLVWNHQQHFEPNANTDYLDPTNHLPVDLISGYESGGITLNSTGATGTSPTTGRNSPVDRQDVRHVPVPMGHQRRREFQRPLELPVQSVHPHG